jgi:hypothetical protein
VRGVVARRVVERRSVVEAFTVVSVHYKAVRGGGGGEWRTCAMRDDEPRPVWARVCLFKRRWVLTDSGPNLSSNRDNCRNGRAPLCYKSFSASAWGRDYFESRAPSKESAQGWALPHVSLPIRLICKFTRQTINKNVVSSQISYALIPFPFEVFTLCPLIIKGSALTFSLVKKPRRERHRSSWAGEPPSERRLVCTCEKARGNPQEKTTNQATYYCSLPHIHKSAAKNLPGALRPHTYHVK